MVRGILKLANHLHLTMVKENRENDHELFYSYYWITPERSDHLLVSSGHNVVD